jgi:Leucine-rich repeat (LRR) protein
VSSEFEQRQFTVIHFSPCSASNHLHCLHSYTGPLTRGLKFRPIFDGLPSIEGLWLYFKPATYIFSGIGEYFPILKRLEISQQLIKFVERENFANMKNLEELRLQSNKIGFLPEDVFWDLPNLKILNLSDNRLVEVPAKLLINSKQIEEVDTKNNRIRKSSS